MQRLEVTLIDDAQCELSRRLGSGRRLSLGIFTEALAMKSATINASTHCLCELGRLKRHVKGKVKSKAVLTTLLIYIPGQRWRREFRGGKLSLLELGYSRSNGEGCRSALS